MPKVGFLSKYTPSEAASSQPSREKKDEEEKELKEVVDVPDSDDLYEFFYQPLSPETSTGDLNQSSQPQPSHSEEVAFLKDEMGIQRKPRSTLRELLESRLRKDVPTKAPQIKLPTPPPTQPLWTNLADLKRKREDKGKEVIKGGKNLPPERSRAKGQANNPAQCK